ncbi:MAG TPA: hypothetical protein VFJ43_06795 [Bacteroidia bacterium]|nr:hypothetical protein [Bacteroidia bacterium]
MEKQIIKPEELQGKYICINSTNEILWFSFVEKETDKALLIAVISAPKGSAYASTLGRAWIPKRWLSAVNQSDSDREILPEFNFTRWAGAKLRFFDKDQVQDLYGKKIAEIRKIKSPKK